MKFIYNYNGLPFYTEEDITKRNYYIEYISKGIKDILTKQNKAWAFHRIESGSLIPRELISSNYTEDDMYFINSELALKPETTAASYFYAKDLFNHGAMPPLCVYQASKSYRKEQNNPNTACRFQEFYQLEYQCIYTEDTKNDYQENTISDISNLISNLLNLQTRIVLSDRLPSYSKKTIDIEVFNGDKWMEISSVSLRTDFGTVTMKNKLSNCLVLEIAIGLDRLIYNSNKSREVFSISVTDER